MIYQVDNCKKEVYYQDIEKDHMYIGMMSLDELKKCYSFFHISKSSIERCEEKSVLNENIMIPHRQYYYGLINLINARDVFAKKDVLAFFIFKNLFMVVVLDDEDQHIKDVFDKTSDYVLKQNASITRLVYYFLNELISRDYQYLEDLQDEIEELELRETEDESLSFSHQLRQLNKELLLLRNYYNNIMIMGEELQINYHNIFEQDDMRYFDIFTRRIERLFNNVQMLRELLNQANEIHQARLDYKMNKTMRLFTVVTTIFLPLTLIAGWYGMNFKNMPELQFQYGYYVIIGISIVIVIALIYWFKKKKYL